MTRTGREKLDLNCIFITAERAGTLTRHKGNHPKHGAARSATTPSAPPMAGQALRTTEIARLPIRAPATPAGTPLSVRVFIKNG